MQGTAVPAQLWIYSTPATEMCSVKQQTCLSGRLSWQPAFGVGVEHLPYRARFILTGYIYKTDVRVLKVRSVFLPRDLWWEGFGTRMRN